MATNIRLTPTDPTHFHAVDSVIIHIRPSETITKIIQLAPCRICQAQTNSDELGSAHGNCKKEICKICLPTLTHCPSCRENINKLALGMETRTVRVAPPAQPEPPAVPNNGAMAPGNDPQGAEREDYYALFGLALIVAGLVLLKFLF